MKDIESEMSFSSQIAQQPLPWLVLQEFPSSMVPMLHYTKIACLPCARTIEMIYTKRCVTMSPPTNCAVKQTSSIVVL